jgi:hypothetical protein
MDNIVETRPAAVFHFPVNKIKTGTDSVHRILVTARVNGL